MEGSHARLEMIVRPRLRTIGDDRLPHFDAARSYVLVSNHRSCFDFSLIAAYLARAHRVRHRVLRPGEGLGSLAEIGRQLEVGGVLAGLHPEDRRGRGPDPYLLLSAKPAIGQVLHRTGAPVIPVFIHGLSNSFGEELWRTLTRSRERVVISFGAPLELADLRSRPACATTYLALSQRARAAIRELGSEARHARLAASQGSCRGPQWVSESSPS